MEALQELKAAVHTNAPLSPEARELLAAEVEQRTKGSKPEPIPIDNPGMHRALEDLIAAGDGTTAQWKVVKRLLNRLPA